MADDVTNQTYQSPMYAGAAAEADLKKAILTPEQLDDKYFEEVIKDLSTTNIPKNDQDFWLTQISLTKSSVNLAKKLDLITLAVMEASELFTELAALASVEGFRIKNLGATTGYSRSEIKQTPVEAKPNV